MPSDPVTAYARSVVDGIVPAGKWQRAACQRHLSDLQRNEKGWPWTFRPELAAKALGIFKLYRHYKGEWAGEPIKLEPWQQFVVGSLMGWVHSVTGRRRFRNAFVELPRGNGKSTLAGGLLVLFAFFLNEGGAEAYSVAPLALDTDIPTPDGWKKMGSLAVGDRVFDEQGRPTTVTYVSPVVYDRPCYRMTFSDGQSITCDGEHRWQVLSTLSGRGSLAGIPRSEWYGTSRSVRRDSHVVSTNDIRSTVRTSWGSRNHCIETTKPLDLPDAELPIPPYTLGVWLGDGRSNRGAITTHPNDVEIILGVRLDGFEFSQQKNDKLLAGSILGLRTKLRTHNLLDNKHIPPAYLRGSARQRRALLQGLMDTDGTCTKTGECRFTNRVKSLVDGVAELVHSFGIVANVHSVSVTGAPHYVVSFKAPSSLPVFALTRKRNRQRQVTNQKTRRRYIDSVEPVDSVPVRCISVASESHLYLAGRGMIATHNTKKDQARISFQAGRQMLLRSPALKKHVDSPIGKYNVHNSLTESKMEALGADADTLDGLRPFLVVVDEVHKLPSSDVVDVMESGMGTRLDPLMFEITTAGDDNQSVYGQHYLLSTRVLDGTVPLDQWFAFIASAELEDDWTLEATWRKANPNYGVSIKPDFLQNECKKALANPAEQAKFRRLYLGQKVQSAQGYFSSHDWRACPKLPDESILKLLPCWMGFDLSSTTDITAAVLIWVLENQEFAVKPYFWMPADTLEDRSKEDRMPYVRWRDEGYLRTTPGRTIDRQEVRKQIVEIVSASKVNEFCADPWQMHDLGQQLAEDGVPVILVPQRYEKISMPMKIVQGKILERRIRHDHNPLMAVMVANTATKPDDRGNVMPSKRKSTGRIDGVQALLNGVAQIPVVTPKEPQMFIFGTKS